MAKQSLIAGGRGWKFNSVDFTKHVVNWQDSRQVRNASHEYLKRDGGEGEPMGRAPHISTCSLVYVGNGWREEYLELQAEIDKNPRGLLTHPVYDDMQVLCDGVPNASMNTEDALNTYEATVIFKEDRLDSNVQASPTPSARSQEVDNNNERYNASFATKFAAAYARVSAFFAAAQKFTASAAASSNNRTRDPSLAAQLESVRKLAAAAITALRADPAAQSNATPAQAIGLVEQTFDACAQLLDLVGFQGLVEYRVPAPIHIARLAAQFYGRDGNSRIGEILANNRLPNPGMIPAGARLVMAPPIKR